MNRQHITIPDPDDDMGMPAYDGWADQAHTRLAPGTYPTTTPGVTLTVTDTSSRVSGEDSCDECAGPLGDSKGHDGLCSACGTCSECGEPIDDNEGYDGLCGTCADKAETEGRWS